MPKKKVRLGLIGCGGNMRGAHVPRIQTDGAAEIASVADPEESQAKALMEKYGREVRYYPDYRRMLDREKLDAVVISSPHSMHFEQARRALGRGLHVLVEKPLTLSSRHTLALLALARKKRRILDVSYQRHYYAPHRYARELVQAGTLGKLRAVVAYVTQNWQGVSGWRLVPELSGGGMFMDTGSHLVAVSLWITGLEPAEVSAFMDKTGKPVDINAVVNIRFRQDAYGSLSFVGNASRHDERLAIHGSQGCLVFHLHQWGLKSVLLNDEPLEIPKRIRPTSPDAAFFALIRNGGKGHEPPRFALEVARLTESAYRSWREKRPVRL
ncbi:MAG: Gfo/Idh/MocA family oxidoreductase [Planctomycetes bacterium]|nr:Gfo/Idh/MocA family oxidoreductase [Planctomycetota bacterium]